MCGNQEIKSKIGVHFKINKSLIFPCNNKIALEYQVTRKMSEALLWHLIRDNNSFLVKRERTSRRGAVQFSTEPGNLMNVHCFKYSGVANNATIDISTSDLTIKTKVDRIF